MKKIFLTLAIIAGLTFSINAKDHKGDRRGEGKRIMKELNLSDEQKTKMENLRADFKTKADALDNQALTKKDRADKERELRDAHRNEIKNILTPEQQAKMGKMDGTKPHKRDRGDKNFREGKDRGKLAPEAKEKLRTLKQDYKKEKKAIEMSRIAPEMQKQKLEQLRKKYKEDVEQITGKSK